MQSFTVTKLNGNAYDASALTKTVQGGIESIAFVCSGEMIIFPASDIKSIEWKSGIVEAANAGSPA